MSEHSLGSSYQLALDTVRIKQTKHLVLDVERARDTSAQLEEEKIQATAERLQDKEAVSQVGPLWKPRCQVAKYTLAASYSLYKTQSKIHTTTNCLPAPVTKMPKCQGPDVLILAEVSQR